MTILDFWTKLAQKGYFRCKTEKSQVLRAVMVVTYYVKPFRTGFDRNNGISPSSRRDKESTDYVISVLNSFHPSTQFAYETENNNSILFLDSQLLRVGENIGTRLFRKPTNTDLHIYWQSFAPLQWRHCILKTLVYRGNIVCSNEKHLHSELGVSPESLFIKTMVTHTGSSIAFLIKCKMTSRDNKQ